MKRESLHSFTKMDWILRNWYYAANLITISCNLPKTKIHLIIKSKPKMQQDGTELMINKLQERYFLSCSKPCLWFIFFLLNLESLIDCLLVCFQFNMEISTLCIQKLLVYIRCMDIPREKKANDSDSDNGHGSELSYLVFDYMGLIHQSWSLWTPPFARFQFIWFDPHID